MTKEHNMLTDKNNNTNDKDPSDTIDEDVDPLLEDLFEDVTEDSIDDTYHC
jgi:hypothetical protein|tara:strand:+ start:87 stop:239 length:153 start_codon:yes stop_codon:yes gene_type:complete